MTPTGTARTRTKRFARKDAAPAMRVTARDLVLLDALARYRFLATPHLVALDGGSYASVMRVLRTLYDNGLVDVPRAQIADLIAHGSAPNAYALAMRGARVWAEHTGGHIEHLRWDLKNARVKPLFIRHTLGIAEIMVKLEVACRNNPRVRLVDQDRLLPLMPEATALSRNPYLWSAKVRVGGNLEPINIVPDRLFSLFYADGTRRNYALEYDTGSMPVVARSLKRSSIRKKMLAYLSGWRANEHAKWGFMRLRVLFVTPSEARLAAMRRCLMDITGGKGSGMFLFATPAMLAAAGPLGIGWTSDKGEPASLAG